MISRLPGLLGVKKHITVDTIITPPVMNGYCAEAGICASEMRRRKFATLLRTP